MSGRRPWLRGALLFLRSLASVLLFSCPGLTEPEASTIGELGLDRLEFLIAGMQNRSFRREVAGCIVIVRIPVERKALQVRVSPESVAVDEPDDCSSFKVLLARDAEQALPALLWAASAGSLAGENVLVSVDWIRRECEGRIAMGWNYRFANMLVYAAGKGRLSEDGQHVRAHVEMY